MEKKVIYSSGAPSSPLYSQGVKAGNLVYLSGFTGMNPVTKQLAGESIEEQTRQAILNCESVLKSAGSSLGEVVQVIVLLTDPADFEGMNSEYAKFFHEAPPARMVTKLGVSLPKVKVSIAMTAVAKAIIVRSKTEMAFNPELIVRLSSCVCGTNGASNQI